MFSLVNPINCPIKLCSLQQTLGNNVLTKKNDCNGGGFLNIASTGGDLFGTNGAFQYPSMMCHLLHLYMGPALINVHWKSSALPWQKAIVFLNVLFLYGIRASRMLTGNHILFKKGTKSPGFTRGKNHLTWQKASGMPLSWRSFNPLYSAAFKDQVYEENNGNKPWKTVKEV